MNNSFETIVGEIIQKDHRYDIDAYDFVMETFSYAHKKNKRFKNVTAEALLKGFRELVLKRYGPMTLTVLYSWGVRRTEDIGNIVFNLVDNHLLSRSEEDCYEEFCNGYSFEAVFRQGYQKQLAKKISRMR